MSSFTYLSFVQQSLTRYGMTAYIVLGNIGLLCNIIIFTQRTHRRNPCSLYILSASISGLIGLNFSAVPVVYALDHPNPVTSSLAFCQLQFYFRHSFNQIMRSFFIVACIDRFAISSNHVRIRSFSRYQIAIRIMVCVPIGWLLIAIFPVMLRSLENGQCEGKSGLPSTLLSIYILIVVGIVPLVSMVIFGLLMMKNLKDLHIRVQPITDPNTTAHRLHKRDRDMMKMLIIEVMCYISTTAPLTINLIYQSATQTIVKSNDRQRIESFITYFNGTFLIYFNNSLSFWIYIFTSRSFRLEFKKVFLKYYKTVTGNQTQVNLSIT